MLELCQLSFFIAFFLVLPPLACSSSFKNSSSGLCHYPEMMALLHFKNEFTITSLPNYSYCGYPKTKSWKEGVDCCSWDGITCDAISGHVIGLDLSCSLLVGIIDSNSSLFHLHHLQSLDLSNNFFYASRISPKFGHFSGLKVLDLSNSFLTGLVPVEIGLLSGLMSLDLSYNFGILQMPHIDTIMKNLTNLKQLHLSFVNISSSIPQTLTNLSSLTSLDLSRCSLEGAFPTNIMKLPQLRFLLLFDNLNLFVNPSQFNNLSTSLEVLDFESTNLSGRLPEYSFGSQPPQLREIALRDCNLRGPIPMWIWNATEIISLGGNKFTGGLPLTMNPKSLSTLTYIDLRGNNLCFQLQFFSKMENLIYLDLSNNVISMNGGVDNTFYWPNLIELFLASCNMSEFPNFSRSKYLKLLVISNNIIQGEIPTWLYGVGRNTLTYLDVSHNNLTGGLELLPWNNLNIIEIRSNSFHGLLPLLPPETKSFLASNNQFHGEISSSFCNSTTGLKYLDLSNNRLSGKLPSCLRKLSRNLQVLHLGSNVFHGIVSIKFKKNCSLISMHLDANGFKGKVPSSIKWCKNLQLLDLGNNQFNGSFPSWLDTLPELQVLILKSNDFQGSIKNPSNRNTNSFQKLQILDLSNNSFSGRLPKRYLENFKALKVNSGGNPDNSSKYRNFLQGYYQDSCVLTAKGNTLPYQILTILAAIDLSNNWFSGEIPDSVSQLTTLIFLNFSQNQLSGHIPPSLANLHSLESLDLSRNRLEGNIPPQLTRLTFLEVFNVSENQLRGSIPLGAQFSTFSSDSYVGNPGLCGDPLPKCGAYDHQDVTPSYHYDFYEFVTSFSLWEIISIGFGFGTIFGFIVGGYMLFMVRPLWFSREADKLEYKMVQSFKKRSRIRQRRA